MARTTNQPSAATRRTGGGQPPPREQGRHNEDDQLDNDKRRKGPTDARDEQDDERGASRDGRENANGRSDQKVGENRDGGEHGQSGEYTERGSPKQRPAVSAGMDTLAPVLEAWTQVLKSWSELAETTVKVQQDAFASMISAANATATDITLGDHRNGELAFSAPSTTRDSR